MSETKHTSNFDKLSSQTPAAIFDRATDEVDGIPLPRVGLCYAWEFLCDGETPGRVVNDAGVRALMPFLEGQGMIVEIGGAGDYYKKFAKPAQRYEVTNISPPCDRIIDATSMAFDDNSIDAFISVFAMEHIYDFQAVVDESFRCLKPNGRLLLSVPFMCFYHGAPDDFFRFTRSALDRILHRFRILKAFSSGNRELSVSMMYHEKRVLGSKSSQAVMTAMRVACLPVLIKGLSGNQHDPVNAFSHIYLCEKPQQQQSEHL